MHESLFLNIRTLNMRNHCSSGTPKRQHRHGQQQQHPHSQKQPAEVINLEPLAFTTRCRRPEE